MDAHLSIGLYPKSNRTNPVQTLDSQHFCGAGEIWSQDFLVQDLAQLFLFLGVVVLGLLGGLVTLLVFLAITIFSLGLIIFTMFA
jgi:hypothetical protein